MAVPAFPGPDAAQREDGFLRSPDGLSLYWQRFTPARPRGTVAIFPGGGDHSGRYPALTAALVAAGFQVALLDLRGHGRSDGRRWHVEAFDDYLVDAGAFLAHARAGAAGRPLFVVGHSQGGLIAARFGLVASRGVGSEVAGYVLSSPYLKLAFQPPWPKLLAARVLGNLWPWLPLATGLRYEDLTSDPELQRWTEDDPLYGQGHHPALVRLVAEGAGGGAGRGAALLPPAARAAGGGRPDRRHRRRPRLRRGGRGRATRR